MAPVSRAGDRANPSSADGTRSGCPDLPASEPTKTITATAYAAATNPATQGARVVRSLNTSVPMAVMIPPER
jgi:hypothetical protein